jgi:hypothetical protein
MADNNSGAESEEQDAGAGNYTYYLPGANVDPGLKQGFSGLEGSASAPSAPSTPSTPSDSDDESNYVTDKRYAELYGKSGDGRPSFSEGTYDPDSGLFIGGEFIYNRPGPRGAKGPTVQDYIKSFNKDGFLPYQSAYFSDAKTRGMTNAEATAYVAATMATPGGAAGMQHAYEHGYSHGGAFGTMQNLLEKGWESQFNIDDLKEQAKYREIYEKEFEKSQLSGFELAKAGLQGFASDLASIFSTRSNLRNDPYMMDLITERAKEAGLNPQPVNSAMAAVMDFALPLSAKGLANLIGGGKTIMTITKDGLEYNLSDTGKLSLNTPPADVDYGSDAAPVKGRKPVQRKPVQKKKVVSKKEEKKKDTTKKTDNTEKIKASNIDRLKSYMNLTGKDLSNSKQDLAITDISITEEDFT